MITHAVRNTLLCDSPHLMESKNTKTFENLSGPQFRLRFICLRLIVYVKAKAPKHVYCLNPSDNIALSDSPVYGIITLLH